MITITEYWNKVVDDESNPLGTRVIPDEYEVKSRRKIDGTLSELKRRWKNNSRMTITKDKITEDLGRYYGIHSYIEITEE